MVTVAELVAHLLTMPQNLPVTAYAADESVSAISLENVALEGIYDERWHDGSAWRNDAHVNIIGG